MFHLKTRQAGNGCDGIQVLTRLLLLQNSYYVFNSTNRYITDMSLQRSFKFKMSVAPTILLKHLQGLHQLFWCHLTTF